MPGFVRRQQRGASRLAFASGSFASRASTPLCPAESCLRAECTNGESAAETRPARRIRCGNTSEQAPGHPRESMSPHWFGCALEMSPARVERLRGRRRQRRTAARSWRANAHGTPQPATTIRHISRAARTIRVPEARGRSQASPDYCLIALVHDGCARGDRPRWFPQTPDRVAAWPEAQRDPIGEHCGSKP